MCARERERERVALLFHQPAHAVRSAADMGGGGGGGGRDGNVEVGKEGNYLSIAKLSPPERLLHYDGQRLAKGDRTVTRRCPQTTTFKEKGEPKRIRTEVPLLTGLKPVLNWANVSSPEHTSDTSTNNDSFLN